MNSKMNPSKKISYTSWFKQISNQISAARTATSIKVNTDLLQLYYDIGSSILDVQERLGWGSQIIDKLSQHIKNEFPGSTGFSVRNIKYMRAFALAYPDFPTVQVSLAQIPWYHHISLLAKVKSLDHRLFYIRETERNGWSRDTMLLHVKHKLHQRQGSAITNFEQTLPEPQSELVQQTIKDPYVFDFLTLTDDIKEKDIENQLVEHVSKF